MHVLFTMYGWADEGGGTMLPRQLAKALVRRGHRVTVLSTPPQPAPGKPAYWTTASVDEGVEIHSIHNRPAVFTDPLHPEREVSDPHMVAAVSELVRRVSPDVVHYHSLTTFSMAVAAHLDELGLPSVFSSHNFWLVCPTMYLTDAMPAPPPRPELARPYAERLEAARDLLARRVDRHLSSSQRILDIFAHNGFSVANARVLQQQPPSVDRIWAEVGSDRAPAAPLERPLRVGFVGNLLPHKGVHVLVDAAQRLPDGCEITLYGSGNATYIELLRERDAAGRVRFHGGFEPSDLTSILAEVDVLAVPSTCEEIGPLVALEGLAARVPVVGSRIGGLPELVDDGRTGLLFEPNDVAGLARSLRRFVEEPELLGRMQAAIEAPTGFEAYVDALVDEYVEATAARAARPRTASLEGARSFAAVALADELVADPDLLVGYAGAFGPADDATLVIYAAGWTGAELAERLSAPLAEAGLDGDDAPDLLAVQGGGDGLQEARLAASVDALFSRRAAAPAFARLERTDDAARLRELAERAAA